MSESKRSRIEDSEKRHVSPRIIRDFLLQFPRDVLVDMLCDYSVDHNSIYRDVFHEASRIQSLKRLFVSQLPSYIRTDDLHNMMKDFGYVKECNVVMDRDKRESKCYGFVVFEDAESAARALDTSITVSGRNIYVEIADGPRESHLTKEVREPERSRSRHESRSRHISRSRSHHSSRSRSRRDSRDYRDSHSRHNSRDSRDYRTSQGPLDQRRLFFRGVPYHIHGHDIEREFRRFGEIEEFNLCYDRVTRKSKGYGFIVFRSVRDAEECLRAKAIPMENRKVLVNLASKGKEYLASRKAEQEKARNRAELGHSPDRAPSSGRSHGRDENETDGSVDGEKSENLNIC